MLTAYGFTLKNNNTLINLKYICKFDWDTCSDCLNKLHF